MDNAWINKRLLALLKEARLTLEMWKDVAPAVSLCADIDKAIAAEAAQPVDVESVPGKLCYSAFGVPFIVMEMDKDALTVSRWGKEGIEVTVCRKTAHGSSDRKVTAPEGYALVPLKPTRNILDAICHAKNLTRKGGYAIMTDSELASLYNAALTAAWENTDV